MTGEQPTDVLVRPLRVPTLRLGLLGFYALFEKTLRMKFAYRMATVTALLTSLLGQAVFLLIWSAVYRERPPTALAESRLMGYLIVALAFNAVFSLSVEFRFGQRLRQGLIATDLIRPLGFLPFQMAQAAGDAAANLTFALPIYLLGLATSGADVLPASGGRAVLGVLSLGLGFAINFGLAYLLIEVALITHSIYGAVTARLALHQAFSGLAAPLALLPPPLHAAATWLPFRDLISTPVEIWLGWTPQASVMEALLRQACWAIVLLVAGQSLLHGALRRHQIQGG